MTAVITRVNEIRRHPAFRWLRNIRFHGTSNDRFPVWTKGHAAGGDLVLVVVNLDPHDAQETVLDLDLGAVGLPWQGPTGRTTSWTARPTRGTAATPTCA